MTEMNFIVDKEKCIHCGLCVKDCIANAIEMGENNAPKVAHNGEKKCIKCQHCLAICPTGAISVLGKKPEESNPVNNYPEPEKLLNLIEGRRSFREYKNENTPSEIIEKLKNMVDYVPTGCNARGLYFTYIDNIEVMENIRQSVKTKLKSFLKKIPNFLLGRFAPYKKSILEEKDMTFREAPNMVVVSVESKAPCHDIDPIIALSYFELYAQSLGLGTCWCGLAKMVFKMFPDIAAKLEIPKGYKIAYVMLFGPSKVKYPRTIQPDAYPANTVKSFKL